MRLATLLLSLCGLMTTALPTLAQESTPERCPRLVASAPWVVPPTRIVPAALKMAELETGTVRLTYVGHSTFLIESPQAVTIATDYNDGIRPPITPEIATMNRAHSTHYSVAPDPGIKHLIPGWRDDGKPAVVDLTERDVWIRNVVTDIRGGFTTVRENGNSIFVFEVSGLCIAHLGHLHHTLTRGHFKGLGRIDVVLAPVDGSMTIDIDDMVKVLRSLEAPLVIPMHWFSQATLDRFVARMGRDYELKRADTPTMLLSRDRLPKTPTVLIVPPMHY